MADEEEIVEGEEAVEESAPAGREFVPTAAAKPKSDAYTAMLVLGFLGFLTSIILAGMELYEYYDVQFWVFTKK
jgi:hypothetical protein